MQSVMRSNVAKPLDGGDEVAELAPEIHGINLATLRAPAERRGVSLPRMSPPRFPVREVNRVEGR